MCADRLLGSDGRLQEAMLMTYVHRHLQSDMARPKSKGMAAR